VKVNALLLRHSSNGGTPGGAVALRNASTNERYTSRRRTV
jgi:hypothetical protein